MGQKMQPQQYSSWGEGYDGAVGAQGKASLRSPVARFLLTTRVAS